MMDTKDDATPLSTAELMNLFTADNLLKGTPIYDQVIKLRDNISRSSDGNYIDYDDMGKRIQAEVDDLPKLELQRDIPSGQEGAYQRELLQALNEINDQHDRVLRKVVKLKSRMLNAINLMDMQRSQFAAYFNLAIPVAIHTGALPPKTKVSAGHSKEMAAAQYSDLMDRLDFLAPSLISELELLEGEIKMRKKAQAATYALGKDQVNAMWDSIQSAGNGIGLDDDASALLKRYPLDDEADADLIPSYVSKHTNEVRTAASESFRKPVALDDEEPVGGDIPEGIMTLVDEAVAHSSWKKLTPDELEAALNEDSTPVYITEAGEVLPLTGTHCSACGQPQFTTPSGDSCSNGHGGAAALEDITSMSEAEIVGKFKKTLDPKPMTVVKDEHGNDVLFPTAELEALRAHMEDAKTDPDYKVVYHHGEKEECGACASIAEGFGDIADSHTIGMYQLPETLSQEEAIESMDEGLIGERHEVKFDPPMAASLIAEPLPSAKELLTQEVIAELETVTLAPKLWSIDAVAESIINPTKTLDIEDVPEPVQAAPTGPILENVDLLNETEPLATTAPTAPRKKLMLLDDEELF
jgi:hypothetical protein